MFPQAPFWVVSGFVLLAGKGGLVTEATFSWSRDTWIDVHRQLVVGLLVMVVPWENPHEFSENAGL